MSLPVELLLNIIDHLSDSRLHFPTRDSLSTLQALCVTSKALYTHASRTLYSAISLSSSAPLLLLADRGIPKGRIVRALFLSMDEIGDKFLPAAEILLRSILPTLQRIVFDRPRPAAPLDGLLCFMPLLQEVSFTRLATNLLGLSPTYLEPCPSVRRLALHDYWIDEYHALRICKCFPGVVEVVLAADVSVRLVGDVLSACSELRKITIVRPWSVELWPDNTSVSSADEEEDTEQDKREKNEVVRMLRERDARVVDLLASEEDIAFLPNWAADCVAKGECWDLEGEDWD